MTRRDVLFGVFALFVALTCGAMEHRRGYREGYDSGRHAERLFGPQWDTTISGWTFEVTPDSSRIVVPGRVAIRGYWLSDDEALRYIEERMDREGWQQLTADGATIKMRPGIYYADTTGGAR